MTQKAIQVPTTPPLSGAALVTDVNDALMTIATDFAGATDPAAVASPFMTWSDTANGRVKRRNAAGSAWVDIGPLFAEPATPPDGALYASQAWVNRRLAQFGTPLIMVPPNALPTANRGEIWVEGYGPYRWGDGVYLPNKLPAKHRNNAGVTTPSNVSIQVPAGSWRSEADFSDIILAAARSKNLQTSGGWSAGEGGNGICSGARAANTPYHIFVIQNTATGAVDVCLDTDPNAGNRPAGYTQYRWVGWRVTDASGIIIPLLQNGMFFSWAYRRADASPVSVTSSGLNLSLSVPAGRICRADISIVGRLAGTKVMITPGGLATTGTITDYTGDGGPVGADTPTSRLTVTTSTAGQIYLRAPVTSNWDVFTVAFEAID